MSDTQMVLTHTGKIYFNPMRGLEFLTVGDYGKENNIKANFLGLTKEIDGVTHREVDLRDKWVATISTQKGCPMSCTFCDVHKYGFFGNASLPDLEYQIRYIIEHEDVRFTNLNVHYARMGEPTWNPVVLEFTENRLDQLVKECGLHAVTIHPVVSTMMPKGNQHLIGYLHRWCEIKNSLRHGEAGLQLSINSTSESERDRCHFRRASYAGWQKVYAEFCRNRRDDPGRHCFRQLFRQRKVYRQDYADPPD